MADLMEIDEPRPPPAEEATITEQPGPQPEQDTEFPYSADFADSMIQPVLNPPPRATKAVNGIRVLHPHSKDIPKSTTIQFQAVNPDALPSIDPSELPIPIDDPRRVYASGIPGIRLTHPGGPLQGGPAARSHNTASGQVQEQPEFVKQFMEQHGITTAAQLQKAIKTEQLALADELRKRMRDREAANEKNHKVQEKVDNLVAEREMERRVYESARRARSED